MPAAIDLEAAVLGCLILHNEAFSKCSDVLTPECFFEQLHRNTFIVTEGLIAQSKPATPSTLKIYLGDQDLGGTTVGAYLANVAANGCSVSQIRDYAVMLNDLAVRREAIAVAEDMLEAAYNSPVDLTGKMLVDTAVDRLSGLKTSIGELSDFEDFSSVSERAILALSNDWRDEGKPKGLPTGYPALDDAIGGLEAPDLVLIGGRPGSGKPRSQRTSPST
jgi:replicative DNA helicase